MFTGLRWTLLAIGLLPCAVLSQPREDFRAGTDFSLALNSASGAYGGTLGSGPVELEPAPPALLTKAPGTLSASVNLLDLAPELGLNALAFLTATESTETSVRWSLTAPGAIGKRVTFVDPDGQSVTVTIRTVSGVLNAALSSKPIEPDPVDTRFRSVLIRPSEGVQELRITGYVVIPAFGVDVTLDAIDYTGAGGEVSGPFVVAGSPALRAFEGDPSGRFVLLRLYRTGEAGAAAEFSTALDGSGGFEVLAPFAGPGFEIWVKVEGFLARRFTGVAIPTLAPITAELAGGDIDGSNSVDLDDYFALADAFRTGPGDPGWNVLADLDGSGRVDLDDYFILADNFRSNGDP